MFFGFLSHIYIHFQAELLHIGAWRNGEGTSYICSLQIKSSTKEYINKTIETSVFLDVYVHYVASCETFLFRSQMRFVMPSMH